MTNSCVTDAPPRAGCFRRLAAGSYDALLLLAVLMLVTAALQLLTGGEAITTARVGPLEYLYRATLAACVAAYYGSAWTRRGQTLGMKAWHVRLETLSGTLPDLRRALLRLAVTVPMVLLALAGVLLAMLHRAGALLALACALPLVGSYAWHAATGGGTLDDRLSRTRVVRVPASAR